VWSNSATTQVLLRQALGRREVTGLERARRWLFQRSFDRLVYPQIWEDPRVDAEALQLGPNSRVLTIASGGCNVLNYALAGPQLIHAIDLNEAHLALTRLKIAAALHLPTHPALYRMFGLGAHPLNVQMYFLFLRAHLGPRTRRYWESRTGLFRQRIEHFESGIYRRGTLSRFFQLVHRIAHVLGHDPNQLIMADSRAEQQSFFDQAVAPFFSHPVVRALGRLPQSVYLLGIPPQQFQLMAAEASTQGDSIISIFRERVRRLVCDFPLSDNYFAWQAFGRCYGPPVAGCVPDYLLEENTEALRRHLPRVTTFHAKLTQHLQTRPAGEYNAVALLDTQDWMGRDALVRLWHELSRACAPGARVVFRTAAEPSPLEAALPAELMDRWTRHGDLSRRLHRQDRSAIYGMVHVYSYRGT
jgi:S-adenosylmethionine-diacylglycerol 3-amino-3-carboxypropyl transferase